MKNLYLILLFIISSTTLMFGGDLQTQLQENTNLMIQPPPIEISSWNWGEHEVTTEKYPILPKIGFDIFGDTSITIRNRSNSNIIINQVSVKILKGDTNAFVLHGFKLGVNDILKKYIYLVIKPHENHIEKIYFSPKSEGLHEIEVNFNYDYIFPATCILSGIGIKSAASIENDYEKDIAIINTGNAIQISKTTDEQLKYKLISLTGSQIASGSLETSTEINLSNFTQQMLFLEISDSKNEVVLWKKVLVE